MFFVLENKEEKYTVEVFMTIFKTLYILLNLLSSTFFQGKFLGRQSPQESERVCKSTTNEILGYI